MKLDLCCGPREEEKLTVTTPHSSVAVTVLHDLLEFESSLKLAKYSRNYDTQYVRMISRARRNEQYLIGLLVVANDEIVQKRMRRTDTRMKHSHSRLVFSSITTRSKIQHSCNVEAV